MPLPNKFKGGGKKGPRQATSKRQPKVNMRPQPAKTPAERAAAAARAAEAAEEDEDDEEEEDEPRYGYREALQGELKPLVGLSVCVSGCSGEKEDLLALAEEYGAERHAGLREDTTHVVTDRAEGAKYQVALERMMHVMMPSWLPAVREAWVDGEEVDWEWLEEQHTMPPLYGVVACCTGFAAGEYKEAFKELLSSSGATVTATLTPAVTHLIVASPSSPHSQTQSSTKLLHARKNRARLHPDFTVVWEGWAREAIAYGGRRAKRDKAWEYNDSGREPDTDLTFAVDVAPPRSGHAQRAAAAGTTASQYQLPPVPMTSTPAPPASRSLVPQALPAVSGSKPAFRGYDPLAVEVPADAVAKPTAFDPANGKVLKKRRRAALGASDSFTGGSQQHGGAAEDYSALLEAYGASQSQQPQAGELSRFADASADDEQHELPSLDVVHAALAARSAEGGGGAEDAGEMALELVPGEVELQYTTKSKSVIRALAKGREGSFASDEGAGAGRKPKPFVAGRKAAPAPTAAEGDDSAFFDAAVAAEESFVPLGATQPAAGKRGAGSKDATPGSSSSPSEEEGPLKQIFAGKSFALMELKGPDPEGVKQVIGARGGRATVNAQGEELAGADWVIVDYVEPAPAFRNSHDPRIVTICWLELCIFYDTCLVPDDRLLERPIPYDCPVEGAKRMKLHFSGFGLEEEPIMHFNRRFAQAIGADSSPVFDRSTTHLVVASLGTAPHLSASDLDGTANPKVGRARQWGKVICSLKELREEVSHLAEEVERRTEDGRANGKGQAKKERSVREITNELDERQREEESYRGPLGDCVVYFSPKIEIDRQRLATIVQDLGGVAARQYSASVTHLVHCGPKASESFKDFKLAKNDGAHIVHPRWVEECGRTSSRASEGDFPHTFDSRKGGQLFDMGMSVNANGGSPPRQTSRSPVESRQGSAAPVARTPSKLSLGRASVSPQRSPAAERAKKRPLELEEERDFGSALPAAASPRRRRSDTTATELADERTDLGGFDGNEQHVLPTPHPEPAPVAAASSSSPSSRRVQQQILSSSGDHPSSDHFDLPVPRDRDETSKSHSHLGQGNTGVGQGGNTQLRHQTSLLLAQLVQPQEKEKPGRKGSKTGLLRKKSSGAGTTSLNASTRLSPALDPVDGTTTSLAPPQRIPGMGYGFEPTQATQEDESLWVVYDNPAEQEARERVREALARNGSRDKADVQDTQMDSPGVRTRRSTRAALGGRR
ncbi:hypothetical protein JCM10213_000770 [Rhodosporidiobolus nylandii]